MIRFGAVSLLSVVTHAALASPAGQAAPPAQTAPVGGAAPSPLPFPTPATPRDLPIVKIDRDDLRVTQSCRLEPGTSPIVDANGNGVVQIEGSDLIIDLGGGTLAGGFAAAAPWDRSGIGIAIRGKNVILRNGSIRGFKVGVLVTECDGFKAEMLDLSGNFGQRLASTSIAEDGADWLWPHENDGQEWRTKYGAALCIERSNNCVIQRVRAVSQGGQNGIMLDRVIGSTVVECDCSFLSGWGLAMWRSSANVIARNSFDFCVRGYSHGVYNRGQDSAGILMFEQCSDNLIAINSVTHSGDGIFIFAGNEALGPEVRSPPRAGGADAMGGTHADDPAVIAARERGCNRNRILGNDFSDAVAHGIELTFSFDNVIAFNTIRRCGISGTWGGYSRGTAILGNVYDANGTHPENPGEEAGISTEHGARLLIAHNQFRNQGVAIKLWWDEDAGLLSKAWAHANGAECGANVIVENTFENDRVAVELRKCTDVLVTANQFKGVSIEVDAVPAASTSLKRPGPNETGGRILKARKELMTISGTREPIGARAALDGRDKIVMTERGPYDWSAPLLVLDRSEGGADVWRLLGPSAFRSAVVPGVTSITMRGGADGAPITVAPDDESGHGAVIPYEIQVYVAGSEVPVVGRGTLVGARWDARFFAWTIDPRTDLEGWRGEAKGGVPAELRTIQLRYGGRGPSDLGLSDALGAAKLPSDRFGMIARTTLVMPAGHYRFRVVSDDGVRLTVDGKPLIERWDWHAPTEDVGELVLAEERSIDFELEHFELDGHAELTLAIERTAVSPPHAQPAPPAAKPPASPPPMLTVPAAPPPAAPAPTPAPPP